MILRDQPWRIGSIVTRSRKYFVDHIFELVGKLQQVVWDRPIFTQRFNFINSLLVPSLEHRSIKNSWNCHGTLALGLNKCKLNLKIPRVLYLIIIIYKLFISEQQIICQPLLCKNFNQFGFGIIIIRRISTHFKNFEYIILVQLKKIKAIII